MEKSCHFWMSSLGAICLFLVLFPLRACAYTGKNTGGVPEVPVLRNILLEEFTAIHCSYCPSGHAIAQNMHHVLGGRLQTIAVHVSNLAAPSGNEPDLRSDVGEEWYTRQGQGGMPSGAMNRYRFAEFGYGESYALSRGDWQAAARSLLDDTATVNLYAEATFDTNTRELRVRVEYFYPEAVSDPFHRLTVALTENYVLGTQSGSASGGKYLHRHVLRDLLTDTWGDTIRETEAGKVWEKTCTLTLPKEYGNRAPVWQNLEVVAFMSAANGEVLNSTAAGVDYKGRYAAPSVSLSVPSLSKYHSRTSIPVRIENLGTDTLKSVCFSIQWGNETYTPELASLAIPYGEEYETEVPIGEYPFSKVTKYRIMANRVNGAEIESNTVSDYVSQPFSVATDQVEITLTTDEYGGDVTYAILNRKGEVLQSGGPFENGRVQTEAITFDLQKGEVYSFEVRDAFLDGFEGGYTITDGEGKEIVFARYVDMYGATVSFMREEETAVEEEMLAGTGDPKIRMSHNPVPATRPANELRLDGFKSGPLDMEVFDVQGKVVFRTRIPVQSPSGSTYRLDTQSFRPGFYFIKVGNDGSTAVEKMVVQ